MTQTPRLWGVRRRLGGGLDLTLATLHWLSVGHDVARLACGFSVGVHFSIVRHVKPCL
ncbi:hypothetical protein HanRHA438_Chr04g0201781 [Helianthus annuus]|nr:hypothetical protein HanRHA438_Chr04g0201781 [Helianthus annuus]